MSVVSIERGSDAESITRALRGFTELRGFELTCEAAASRYSLRLTLANPAGICRTLVCGDVQNLELNATGEGFEQLRLLRVDDVSAEGLGRIRYTIDELETEAIFLHCGQVELLG
jgi:hypothetical protein